MRKILLTSSILLTSTSLVFAVPVVSHAAKTVGDAVGNAMLTTADMTTKTIKKTSEMTSNAYKMTTNAYKNVSSTWGVQDRSKKMYIGLGANAAINGVNSKSDNSGLNAVVGYNFDKYFGIQFSQFVTYNGMFGGLTEAVVNFSNNTMITPYATSGFGYASLTNDIKPAWDVGGGIKFATSECTSLFVDYKYIQTIGPTTYNHSVDSNAAGSVNMISAGINFYL